MYNRQEYSHNFALSDRCFSTCLLCYSSWRKFFSQTSMLHTYLLQSLWCFKRLAHMFQETLPWHQLSREGGGIFIEWGSGGPRDYISKKDKYSLSSLRHYRGCPLKLQSESKLCALPKNFIFFSVNFMLNRAILLPTFSQSVDTFIHFLIFSPLQLLLETRTMTQ